MMNRIKLHDIHGIHLLDYEPYYLSKGDLKNSELLSCNFSECYLQVKDFSLNYSGRIGLLPYPFVGFAEKEVIPYSYENQHMYRAYTLLDSKSLGDSILPFFVAYPGDRDYTREISGILGKVKIPFGFKFHGLAMQKPISSLENSHFMDFVKEIGAPIILHTGNESFSDPIQILSLAKKYPSLNFIAAHFGALSSKFIQESLYFSNIFLDSAILSELTRRIVGDSDWSRFEKFLSNAHLEERVVFGSDYPWTKLFNSTPALERQFLLDSPLEPQFKHNWAWSNARKLFK